MNIYTNHANYVLGFHGCDKSVVDKVINSADEHLTFSQNDYDWLGSGIYFWLNDPQRALEWAKEKRKRAPEKIKEPAVIGAIIDLRVCLNLTERECVETVRKGYEILKEVIELPKDLVNRAPDKGGFNLLRPLDCAVINFTYSLLKSKKSEFDSVMGVFQEGETAYKGSDILAKTHTQICVRNPDCIMGYFLPRLGNI